LETLSANNNKIVILIFVRIKVTRVEPGIARRAAELENFGRGEQMEVYTQQLFLPGKLCWNLKGI
jgi:hypothetical protein